MATILVIDDERMICDLLQTALNRHGHEVLTACSGSEGIELFRQRRPRVTLLDLHMPEMNGIEVLKHIRAIDPKPSVVMLTGGGTDDLENLARQLGVTDFLRKGLSLDVVVRITERILEQPAKATQTPLPSAGKASAPPGTLAAESILVVDDEPMILDLISQFLTLRGYRVRVAQDGPTALALVAQERPHLIVSDIYMPGMNGLELLRELRAKEYTGGFLALTSSQDEKVLQDALDLGSVDVMGKPVELERLELAVQLGCALAGP